MSERDEGMSTGYVIKVADSEGRESWITPANSDGIRSLSVKSDAAVFSNQEQAQLAVNALRLVLTDLGTVFAIEPAE